MTRFAGWFWLPLVCVNVACAASPAGEQKAIRHETSADELQRAGEFSAASGDLTRAEQYYVSAPRAGGDERAIVKPAGGSGRRPARLARLERTAFQAAQRVRAPDARRLHYSKPRSACPPQHPAQSVARRLGELSLGIELQVLQVLHVREICIGARLAQHTGKH